MTNAKKRRLIGWGCVTAIILFFLLSFFIGSSGQRFLATWLFAHLPLFIVPFLILFGTSKPPAQRNSRALIWGWVAWMASAILWEVCYHSLYRRFGWGTPDLPGEFLFGLILGWLPAAVITSVAGVSKLILDWALPVGEDDNVA